jgi:hypothetical protein
MIASAEEGAAGVSMGANRLNTVHQIVRVRASRISTSSSTPLFEQVSHNLVTFRL